MVWYTATQPLFFPKIHMVERFARCHAVVVLEEAQWQRHGGHTRTEVVGPNGRFRLSLPVRGKGQRPMDQLLVAHGWSKRVLKSLEGAYGRFAGWKLLAQEFATMLRETDFEGARICDVGFEIICWLSAVLGLDSKVYTSRGLVPRRPPEPTAWMASFAQELGATDYVQGASGIEGYFRAETFRTHNCRVWGQTYAIPYDPPDVSVLDPLLRHGPAFVRDLIKADLGPGAAAGTVVRMESYE